MKLFSRVFIRMLLIAAHGAADAAVAHFDDFLIGETSLLLLCKFKARSLSGKQSVYIPNMNSSWS